MKRRGRTSLLPPHTFLRPRGACGHPAGRWLLPWNPSPSGDILEIRFYPPSPLQALRLLSRWGKEQANTAGPRTSPLVLARVPRRPASAGCPGGPGRPEQARVSAVCRHTDPIPPPWADGMEKRALGLLQLQVSVSTEWRTNPAARWPRVWWHFTRALEIPRMPLPGSQSPLHFRLDPQKSQS